MKKTINYGILGMNNEGHKTTKSLTKKYLQFESDSNEKASYMTKLTKVHI